MKKKTKNKKQKTHTLRVLGLINRSRPACLPRWDGASLRRHNDDVVRTLLCGTIEKWPRHRRSQRRFLNDECEERHQQTAAASESPLTYYGSYVGVFNVFRSSQLSKGSTVLWCAMTSPGYFFSIGELLQQSWRRVCAWVRRERESM